MSNQEKRMLVASMDLLRALREPRLPEEQVRTHMAELQYEVNSARRALRVRHPEADRPELIV